MMVTFSCTLYIQGQNVFILKKIGFNMERFPCVSSINLTAHTRILNFPFFFSQQNNSFCVTSCLNFTPVGRGGGEALMTWEQDIPYVGLSS